MNASLIQMQFDSGRMFGRNEAATMVRKYYETRPAGEAYDLEKLAKRIEGGER